MTELQIGLSVVALMVCWEVVKFAVQRFLKKTAGTQYVTVEDCRQCRAECNRATSGEKGELLQIISDLRNEVKQLRGIIIRHLLLNQIDDAAGREELQRMLDG